jgi:hypothetical protein
MMGFSTSSIFCINLGITSKMFNFVNLKLFAQMSKSNDTTHTYTKTVFNLFTIYYTLWWIYIFGMSRFLLQCASKPEKKLNIYILQIKAHNNKLKR